MQINSNTFQARTGTIRSYTAMLAVIIEGFFQMNNQLSGLNLGPNPASPSLAPSLWQ
jgi:hypothetical protein